MLVPKKLTIGVRPHRKMFRVVSLWGVLVDDLLALRGTSAIDEKYFDRVARTERQGFVQLINDELGNLFRLAPEDVLLRREAYTRKSHIDVDETVRQFGQLWKAVDRRLDIGEIRRIGIVGEFRIKVPNRTGSAALLNQLTKFQVEGSPAKFQLQFEARRSPKPFEEEEINSADFINVIYQIYDSAIDTESPEPGHINANLDLQKYYFPHHSKSVPDAVEQIGFQFRKEVAAFRELLLKLELRQDV